MASGTMYSNAVTDLYGEDTATEVIDFDTEERFIVYYNGANSTGTKPTTANGYLITIVRAGEATKVQFCTAAQRTDFVLYMRKMFSSTWGSWKSVTFS